MGFLSEMKTNRINRSLVVAVMTISLAMFTSMLRVIVVSASANTETVFNNASLTPVNTCYEPANQAIDSAINAITTKEMTSYQKIKACYDYLINSCSYGQNNEVYNRLEDFFFGDTGGVEAYCMLAEHVGVCDDYSSAFVAMARKLGYNSYIATGLTHRAKGGYSPHAWAVIKIDEVEYVFDPQIEDNIAKDGKITYCRFAKTYDQVKDKYIFEAISDKFVPFDYTENAYLKPSIIHMD